MTRLTTLLLAFAVALALAPSAAGQARTYELVGGELLVGTLEAHEQGQYLAVRPVESADTLWVWVQGVTPTKGPSRAAARAADLVAWCFPKEHPDPRHVLPGARRVVVFTERYAKKRWISFVDEDTVRRVGGGKGRVRLGPRCYGQLTCAENRRILSVVMKE